MHSKLEDLFHVKFITSCFLNSTKRLKCDRKSDLVSSLISFHWNKMFDNLPLIVFLCQHNEKSQNSLGKRFRIFLDLFWRRLYNRKSLFSFQPLFERQKTVSQNSRGRDCRSIAHWTANAAGARRQDPKVHGKRECLK